MMSPKIAAQLTELMIGVVNEGTGLAGAIPEAQVAGKTGTAELGPKPGQENLPPGAIPEQIVDAWFTAFAPAEKPRLAVAVMLIDADADGGTSPLRSRPRSSRPASSRRGPPGRRARRRRRPRQRRAR